MPETSVTAKRASGHLTKNAVFLKIVSVTLLRQNKIIFGTGPKKDSLKAKKRKKLKKNQLILVLSRVCVF